MRSTIALILILICVPCLWAEQTQKEADEIASNLALLIEAGSPVFLDLRCGEWTPALSQSLSEELLAKGVDLREIKTHTLFDEESEMPQSILLADYGITEARLVQVTLDLHWQVIEHKSFFSYRSERIPVYRFVVKQLVLPQHQLNKVDTYDFSPVGSRDSSISAPRLRWFDPLIAGTALASIIFLLWTIE
ncbi:MAG: hypothetical protein KBB33_02825 [Candidatus Cloacimonetes bacterium]|nr:hypothetical protein [Candidatus Cloacimonadota bacterium]HOH59923.1 hypothetical protein [Candidatus Cloacimonadota bacterium]HPI25234.1 hypothetical protein [Candidatus Cloacimonadota bacterium]